MLSENVKKGSFVWKLLPSSMGVSPTEYTATMTSFCYTYLVHTGEDIKTTIDTVWVE